MPLSHAERVCLSALRAGYDPDIVAAALLHDHVEDDLASFQEIAEATNERVAELVAVLTRIPSVQTYAAYLDEICADPAAARIKLLDIEDHLAPERVGNLTDSHRLRYESARDRIRRSL